MLLVDILCCSKRGKGDEQPLIERVWRFGSLVGVIMCAYLLTMAHPCAKLAYDRRPPGYRPPMYTDLSTLVVPGITATIFFAIKKLFWPLFTPLWRPHCKDQHDA